MTLQPASEGELEQHDMDLPGRDPGRSDQLVDIDGARPQRTKDQLPFALAGVGRGRRWALSLLAFSSATLIR